MDEIETAASAEGEALPGTDDNTSDLDETKESPSTLRQSSGQAGSGRAEEESSDETETGTDTETEEPLEEIERDGRRARIPAWLKPELMMQADYTRKTQELAAARRAFEAERSSVQQAGEAELSAHGNLAMIDRQIADFTKVDWNAWYDADAAAAQKAFAQFQLLKDARAQTLGALAHLQNERTVREQQETAKRMEEGAAELARDIPDWSPTTATRLLDFGQKHYGFAREDLDGIDDPRLVKVLHAAFQWETHQKKQRQAQSHAAAQTTRPAAKVGGASPKPGLDDRLSADEWLRRRNEQVRKRRG